MKPHFSNMSQNKIEATVEPYCLQFFSQPSTPRCTTALVALCERQVAGSAGGASMAWAETVSVW